VGSAQDQQRTAQLLELHRSTQHNAKRLQVAEAGLLLETNFLLKKLRAAGQLVAQCTRSMASAKQGNSSSSSSSSSLQTPPARFISHIRNIIEGNPLSASSSTATTTAATTTTTAATASTTEASSSSTSSASHQ
jgi:hypothetical protein